MVPSMLSINHIQSGELTLHLTSTALRRTAGVPGLSCILLLLGRMVASVSAMVLGAILWLMGASVLWVGPNGPSGSTSVCWDTSSPFKADIKCSLQSHPWCFSKYQAISFLLGVLIPPYTLLCCHIYYSVSQLFIDIFSLFLYHDPLSLTRDCVLIITVSSKQRIYVYWLLWWFKELEFRPKVP